MGVPTVIITNKIDYYNSFLQDEEWHKDVFLVTFGPGVSLIPPEHRKERLVETQRVGYQKKASNVLDSYLKSTPKVIKSERKKALIKIIDESVCEFPQEIIDLLRKNKNAVLRAIPDESSQDSRAGI